MLPVGQSNRRFTCPCGLAFGLPKPGLKVRETQNAGGDGHGLEEVTKRTDITQSETQPLASPP